MSDETRLLPHSLDAERAVLGAVLVHPPALYQATEIIHADDFYLEAHRRILDAMLRLQVSETPIDSLTLKTELQRSGELEKVGGTGYVVKLTDGIPGAINVRSYAEIVRENSILRRLIRFGNGAAQRAYGAQESSKDILEDLQLDLVKLLQSNKRSGWLKIGDLVQEAYNELDALSRRKRTVIGLDTGFSDLNSLIGGFQPGQLIVIAGRPGHGKTSLGLNLIATALQHHHRVALFTIEMSALEITKRILYADAEVDSHKVAAGYISKDEWTRIGTAAGKLAETNLSVDESGSLTIMDLRSRAQQLALAGGLDMLVIDYLQLMAGSHLRRGEHNRVQEISDISRALKALAKDLRIPIIAMSQLNREVERESKRRPRLADLRESGSIEQDADVVLFIWREELRGATDDNRGQAELIIGKQRNGPVGETVNLTFIKQYTKFVSCSKRESDTGNNTERELWYQQES